MDKPIEIRIQGSDSEDVSTKETVKNIKENFDHLAEMQTLNARLRRKHFEGLVEAGFTEEQAMWLIK
jgi:hypothetical protein